MASSRGGGFHQNEGSGAGGGGGGGGSVLPPWLSNVRPSAPSVTLSLSPTAIPPPPAPGIGIRWFHSENGVGNVPMIPELVECCKELEEMQRAWTAHKKEALWRLRRLELQLESEKASRKREKVEEIEAKISGLKEEEKVALQRIEAEYKEQLATLRRDAETKEQKLADHWAAKHLRLTKFLDQMGCRSLLSDPNPR